eukprot:352355-Amphidinium_carterae.1
MEIPGTGSAVMRTGTAKEMLLTRDQLCGVHPQLSPSRCVHAVLEHNTLLVLESFMHFAITTPALYVAVGRSMDV